MKNEYKFYPCYVIPLCLLLLLPTGRMMAQLHTLEWAEKMGGGGVDMANAMAADASGNIYTTGTFQATAQFGNAHQLTSSGGNDVFVCKSNPEGAILWVKQIGGPDNDYSAAITVDQQGNVTIAGHFSGTADLDPGAGSHPCSSLMGTTDIFVCQLDQNGNFRWARQMGGISADGSSAIISDASNHIYLSGYFVGNLFYDGANGVQQSATSAGSYDFFVLKLDQDGNFHWFRQVGGSSYDFANALALDTDNNLFVTGNFWGSLTLNTSGGDTTVVSAGGADIFLIKADTAGNLHWISHIGGSGDDDADDVLCDAAGNVYLCGYYNSTVDFDPGANVVNRTVPGINKDIFLLKLSGEGEFQWVTTMGGPLDDEATALAYDGQNLFVTGYFRDVLQFETAQQMLPLQSAGSVDAFLLQTSPEGSILWTRALGGSQNDYGKTIVADQQRSIISAGYFAGTAGFDRDFSPHDLTSAGGPDIYLHKLAPCSPRNIQVNVSADALSVLEMPGASYQWLDCTSLTAIDGATSAQMELTQRGTYAVVVSQGGCRDTSDCITAEPVNIFTLEPGVHFLLYPNPAHKEVCIQTKVSGRVEILDLQGRTLIPQHIMPGNNWLDISRLPAGLYIIAMETQEGSRVRKKLVVH